MRQLASSVVLLLSLAAANTVRAADPYDLTTSDFKTERASVSSVDEAGVHVSSPGGDQVVPMTRFLELSRPAGIAVIAVPGRFMLHLVGGDRIGGEPVEIKNDQLVWKSVAVGDIMFPLNRVAAITKPEQSPDDAKRTEDVVTLANGDTVRGIIKGLDSSKITVKTEAGEQPVPTDTVGSVYFATAAGAQAPAERGFRVRFDDGSSVLGSALKLAENKIQLSLGGENRTIDASRVSSIEQVNGPVSWLTSRQPSENIYTPFMGNTVALARINRSVDGGSLQCGGKVYARGIGVHSYSRLSYPLDGKYAAFRTRYGINDKCPRGDVTVRIKLDGKTVHEKANVRAGALGPVVVVDLAGAKQLTLEVDFGQGKHVDDHLDWIEPALLREKPSQVEPAEIPATEPSTKPASRPAVDPMPALGPSREK